MKIQFRPAVKTYDDPDLLMQDVCNKMQLSCTFPSKCQLLEIKKDKHDLDIHKCLAVSYRNTDDDSVLKERRLNQIVRKLREAGMEVNLIEKEATDDGGLS